MIINQQLHFTVLPWVILACFTLPAMPANATNYTFTTLAIPNETLGAQAYGINASGQIAGVYYDSQGGHGFIYNGQDYTPLDVPTATAGTFAYGINDNGQVVGDYIDGSGKHGFLYNRGVYTAINNPNGFDTNATGINNRGQVVGNYRLGTTGIYGFFYEPQSNTYTTINNPKASAGNTSATAINNNGEGAGFFYNTGAHGFMYDGSNFTTLNAPQAALAGTFTYGLNNQGLMVGVYYDSKRAANSYMFDGSHYSPLALPNAKTTFANGINDNGQVVGYYTDNTGSHAFLATPGLDPGSATQLAFRNVQPTYKAGETLSITVQEHTLVRKEALDLWVAIELPNAELRYLNIDQPTAVCVNPQPFHKNVTIDLVQHAIASFVIPKGVTGHYTLYAIYTTPGSDLSHLAQTSRSNIAKMEFDLQ
ncbi:MAG: hypothetical protein QX197_01795 [Methylococcaceae bacterium]